jgi:hypothetical protein
MKKTQIGWVIIIAAIFAVCITYFQGASPSIMIQISIGMAALVLFFGTLTLKVTYEYVKFSFGIGLFYGKIKIDNIESCRTISYFPLGWGIRFRPGVTIFNVSGYKAIEIIRINRHQRIWIGTEQPEVFAAYILLKMNERKVECCNN